LAVPLNVHSKGEKAVVVAKYVNFSHRANKYSNDVLDGPSSPPNVALLKLVQLSASARIMASGTAAKGGTNPRCSIDDGVGRNHGPTNEMGEVRAESEKLRHKVSAKYAEHRTSDEVCVSNLRVVGG
jgi:hypothetical protein